MFRKTISMSLVVALIVTTVLIYEPLLIRNVYASMRFENDSVSSAGIANEPGRFYVAVPVSWTTWRHTQPVTLWDRGVPGGYSDDRFGNPAGEGIFSPWHVGFHPSNIPGLSPDAQLVDAFIHCNSFSNSFDWDDGVYMPGWNLSGQFSLEIWNQRASWAKVEARQQPNGAVEYRFGVHLSTPGGTYPGFGSFHLQEMANEFLIKYATEGMKDRFCQGRNLSKQ